MKIVSILRKLGASSVYTVPAVIIVAGFALWLGLFAALRQAEQRNLRERFHKDAGLRAEMLRAELSEATLMLDALRGLFMSSPAVGRRQFGDFSRELLRGHRGIQALEWIPRAPAAERGAYEAAAQREGFAGFSFTERSRQGLMAPAAERAEYYPVYYVEPCAGNESALGFDLGSDPAWKQALELARQSGGAQASGKIALSREREDNADNFGALFIAPIRDPPTAARGNDSYDPRGFVAAVLRIGDALELALGNRGGADLTCDLYDVSDPGARDWLGSYPHGRSERGDAGVEPAIADASAARTLELAGRRWELACRPTPQFLAEGYTWRPWALLGMGLLLTSSSAVYLGATSRAAARARECGRQFTRAQEALEREAAERHRAETAARRAEEKLFLVQKMESVGRLAGGVAHDFNNLLTGIRGYTQLLLRQTPPGSPARRDLRQIRDLSDRAAELTRQLLAFARRQSLKPQVVNLNSLAHDMAKMLERVIGEDVLLRFSPAPDLGNVKVDAGQIEQVLMNLATNARDAMPRGGTLTLETANVNLDERYAAMRPGVQPGAYVMLAVSDTGCGMSAEVQAHAFEPFYTTKPVGRGTGLGLATVYGIVKQHGGNIWVYSESGRGTTFKIYLPRVDAETTQRVEAPEQAPPRGHETIVLVEDERSVRELLRRVLAEQGYAVLEAGDAEEAERLLARSGQAPALLLTDVVLPGRSGATLHESLSRRHPRLKVIFMSGYTNNAVIHGGAIEAGAPYLQKPFDPTTLAELVRKTLDGAPPLPAGMPWPDRETAQG